MKRTTGMFTLISIKPSDLYTFDKSRGGGDRWKLRNDLFQIQVKYQNYLFDLQYQFNSNKKKKSVQNLEYELSVLEYIRITRWLSNVNEAVCARDYIHAIIAFLVVMRVCNLMQMNYACIIHF